MACNCGCNNCDDGMLAGLMGDVLIQAANFPVWPGARFQFGFNISAFSNRKPGRPEELAIHIENAGLGYNTVSYYVAGWLNQFFTIEGNSIAYWESAQDFCNEIRSTLSYNGIDVE